MKSYFRKNMEEELGRRAMLSMQGKAIIGVIGGSMVALVTCFRSCTKHEPLDPPNVQWLNYTILDRATTLDPAKRASYFSKLGINQNIDSVVDFLAFSSVGGALVHEMNIHEVASINSTFDLQIPHPGADVTSYYVESLKQADYVISTKDSLVQLIVSIPDQSKLLRDNITTR